MIMLRGIYIHIPFCSEKCPYCDFVSIVEENSDIHKEYINSILKEIDLYIEEDFSVKSIYFGGGTPSLLKPDLIAFLVENIFKKVRINNRPEITVEVNPENYRFADFKILKEAGINRISIGSQSFLEKNLKALGRKHSPEDVLKTVDSAFKAGIENINLDMIYGITGQSLSDLEKDLKAYISLPVKHISAYMLTAYENTPLGIEVEKGRYLLPEDSIILDMFKMIDEYLEQNGFCRYEISNWAQKGYQCRHNLLYWEGEQFLGLGVSAWSYLNGVRFGNTNNLRLYSKIVNEGKKPAVFFEKITPEERRKESIFLGLRLSKGIDLDIVKDKMPFIEQIVNEGLAQVKDGRLILTEEGILVSNYISSMLI